MDAAEQDRDVLIQKSSAELIASFDSSLEPFLRKPNGQLRRRVRVRETARLVSQLLEPFQELPQLLDPHLPKWLPVLANAYLEGLQERRRTKALSTRSQLLIRLPSAICWIIYTLCKIRGEKVIVRFLNVETRYLELLLLAIEDSERIVSAESKLDSAIPWTWQERYVVLLWLSQLFFAPFDLSTISSGDAHDLDRPVIRGFAWPPQVPGITLRVLPLASKYLASPGKERDGAKALLVRVAMRKDMQEMGVLRALVEWALSTLKPTEDGAAESPYFYIGSLSFLAGVLRASADTSIMDPFLSEIFYTAQAISAEENGLFTTINGSALARKMMIKVTRSVITLLLRKKHQSTAETEMVETSIGYLLERLADNDTPVRLAASKALSIITLKLDPDMASQVVEAVLDSLNRNVLWVRNKSDPAALPSRDMTAVDPLEWHGLMLTLSHLLYRRSPPPEDLSNIIHALLMGLAFEKRSPSGGSIGTNVRDASCFGIWALARRYSTAELLQVRTQSVLVAKGHDPKASILQVLATDLVVAASLDPAGNIRRGASAALQEMIGRHPDTIEEGIALVQTVDYHAVALRARAIHEVALQATRLSPHYGRALKEATLGWRGTGDMDAGARRVAATSFGTLTAEMASSAASELSKHIQSSVELLLSRIQALQVRQVEERHGLLLALASIFDLIARLVKMAVPVEQLSGLPLSRMCTSLTEIVQDASATKYRKPDLIAEAVCKLVVSSFLVILLGLAQPSQLSPELLARIQPGSVIVEQQGAVGARGVLRSIRALERNGTEQVENLLSVLVEALSGWMDRNETEVVQASSEAAFILLVFLNPEKGQQVVTKWCDRVRHPPTPRNRHGNGYFHAVARAYVLVESSEEEQEIAIGKTSVTQALAERWGRDTGIETRVAILQSLIDRPILTSQTSTFVDIVSAGLDDYTTNARGDIGSHVRLEAIRAAKSMWKAQKGDQQTILALFPRILRLAAEKLDRVRTEAQSALASTLKPEQSESFSNASISSKEYFDFLFRLRDAQYVSDAVADDRAASVQDCTAVLLAGLVVSADTGNEDLVIVSRAALADFCEQSRENLEQVCTGLLHNLKWYAGQDRVIIPTLEVVAYLFHVGLLQQSRAPLNLRQLCLLVRKAAYKTGNVRKLEACIKVYGAVAAVEVREHAAIGEDDSSIERESTTPEASELAKKRQEGVVEAKRRLGALMVHPWPKIRSLAVDELWGLLANGDIRSDTGEQQQFSAEKLLGVDWGKAEKSYVKTVVGELGLE
ncbi:tubulin folding cofactor D C terminal-domain-containing protein [Xylariomycetidae sp. FL0641]|nr:tubulin folding cofactor D C terminal-domain-containing protein [Xylariomycetidae sp. FL0641]